MTAELSSDRTSSVSTAADTRNRGRRERDDTLGGLGKSGTGQISMLPRPLH
jgi:hypothetical protein